MKDLEKDLASLLNRHSLENKSGTPDYILARYLMGCLKTWDESVRARERWYGREANPVPE